MNTATPNRAVVAVPGGKFGPYVPTLMFSTDAAEERGASLYPVERFLDDIVWPVNRS